MANEHVHPIFRDILNAMAAPRLQPCKCGSLECGPIRCRFDDPKDERVQPAQRPIGA